MATFNACQMLNERLAPVREKYPGSTWEELIKHAWLDRIDLSARGFTKVFGHLQFSCFCSLISFLSYSVFVFFIYLFICLFCSLLYYFC
jgi:hypothetical protein